MKFTISNISTIIFFLLLVIEIVLDLVYSKKTIKCIKKQTIINRFLLILFIILHHIILIFLMFGWLLSGIWLIVYLISILLVNLSWMFTDGLCWLTVIENNICGWEKEKPFNHIFTLLDVKKTNTYYIFIIFAIGIAIYKLINHY